VSEVLLALLRSLVANPHYKLLSLLVALGAWLWVQGEEVVQAQVRVNVTWELPEDLVTEAPLPRSVLVTLRGARNVVRRVRDTQPTMALDLSDVDVGEHRIEFGMANIRGLPSGAEVVSHTPASVGIALDRLATRKVRVRAVRVGEPDHTVAVVGVTLDPAVVTVQGPAQAIADLVEVSTVPIDVTGLAGDSRVPFEVELPQGAAVIGVSRLSAEVDVEDRFTRRTFSTVPVYVWQQPDWRPITEAIQVQLEGPAAELRSLASDSVLAFVHLPREPSRTRYAADFGPSEGLRVRIVHPGSSEVKVNAVEPAQVEVFRP
jgi:YbbR domain-containing protein